MTAYHAIHESPYADDCPTCAGMDEPPPPVVAPWWMRLGPRPAPRRRPHAALEAPMTPDDLAAIRSRHRQGCDGRCPIHKEPICVGCGQSYPCDAIRLLDAGVTPPPSPDLVAAAHPTHCVVCDAHADDMIHGQTTCILCPHAGEHHGYAPPPNPYGWDNPAPGTSLWRLRSHPDTMQQEDWERLARAYTVTPPPSPDLLAAAREHGLCSCGDFGGPRPLGNGQEYHYVGCDYDPALRAAIEEVGR